MKAEDYRNAKYNPTDIVSRWLTGGFVGFAAISLLTAFSQTLNVNDDDVTSLLISSLPFLESIAFMYTAAFFLTWFHRAYKNLPALGVRYLEYSPRWAVGAFFVPFLNLWQPYEVMQEVWRASDPKRTEEGTWRLVKSSPLVMWWWGVFVASEIAAQRAFLLGLLMPGDAFGSSLSSWLSIISELLLLASAFVSIILVIEINERQTAKFASRSQSKSVGR